MWLNRWCIVSIPYTTVSSYMRKAQVYNMKIVQLCINICTPLPRHTHTHTQSEALKLSEFVCNLQTLYHNLLFLILLFIHRKRLSQVRLLGEKEGQRLSSDEHSRVVWHGRSKTKSVSIIEECSRELSAGQSKQGKTTKMTNNKLKTNRCHDQGLSITLSSCKKFSNSVLIETKNIQNDKLYSS